MSILTQEQLAYYAAPGVMTGIGPHTDMLAGLPSDAAGLVRLVQGVLLHVFWTKAYGIEALPPERQSEVNLHTLSEMLARARELDGRPLVEARPLERKLVGNCRHFSTLLAGLFRAQGIPARARCGFGTYFTPDRAEPHYEDHWVAEYWNAAADRWVMLDAQLDATQREALRIDFDPLDMPPGRFVTGGEAWQMIRSGEANPDHFGIFDMHGVDFVKGNLLRDLAALSKVETLPWDGWGLGMKYSGRLTAEELALLDRAAALIVAGDAAFEERQAFYTSTPDLCVPNPAALVDLRRLG